MTQCTHEFQIWKGQYKRCLTCQRTFYFKNMNETVILPLPDNSNVKERVYAERTKQEIKEFII